MYPHKPKSSNSNQKTPCYIYMRISILHNRRSEIGAAVQTSLWLELVL